MFKKKDVYHFKKGDEVTLALLVKDFAGIPVEAYQQLTHKKQIISQVFDNNMYALQDCSWCFPGELLVPCRVSYTSKPQDVRVFSSGATRDTDTDKLDYEGFLSPEVLQRYAEYMHKHRLQPDGTIRSADNWQKLYGTPEEHKDVCMKSLLRHVMDLWLFHRGAQGRDTKEDALCAIMFNTMAYLYAELKTNKKK